MISEKVSYFVCIHWPEMFMAPQGGRAQVDLECAATLLRAVGSPTART